MAHVALHTSSVFWLLWRSVKLQSLEAKKLQQVMLVSIFFPGLQGFWSQPQGPNFPSPWAIMLALSRVDMSLNWARFQLAFQLQKTLLQPDILELISSRLFWGAKSDQILSCLSDNSFFWALCDNLLGLSLKIPDSSRL